MIEELNERIENKTPAVVYRAIEPSFTWDTAIGYLQVCADAEVGGPVGLMTYKLPNCDQITSIRPVVEYLNENMDAEVIGSEMLITLTTKEDMKYISKNDQLIWNAIGYSELNLNDEDRSIEPGDLIYVPANTEYTFKPACARTAVVFTIGN